MTEIPAAGTADSVSPNYNFAGHQMNDVRPFKLARDIDGHIGDGSDAYVRKYYEVRPRK